MKMLGLLLSLLVLVAFGVLMFLRFISMDFTWRGLLLFTVAGSAVYLIVLRAGGLLDEEFNQSVQGFLNGKNEELSYDKNLLRTLGLLHITLLPFLFYVLALVLFAEALAVSAAIQLPQFILSHPEVFPVFRPLYFGFLFVLVATGVAVANGFYRLFFPPERGVFGITLGQHEQKKLWDLSVHISEEIKAKPVDTIVLSPLPGIAVYSQGNLLSTVVGGGSRALLLGLPSLHGLSAGEFKAILAHEYGHFSNQDTQWNSLSYSMGSSLLSTFRSIPGPGAFRGSVGLVALLNPAYWMVRVFVRLYFKVTAGFSRARELMADIAALNLCGGKTFGQALLKEATNQALFFQVIQPKLLVELSRLGKKASNLSQSIETVYSSTEKSEIRQFQAALLSRAPTRGAYDSHPPLKVRLDYAGKFEQRGETLGGPVQELFEDWKGLNERLTDFYYKRMPPKKCPRCGTVNEPFAERCRCGVVFIPPYRGPVRQLVGPPRSPNGMGEPKSQ